jgi:pimeloyl-ACP methyl ester carboxylesterase
MANADIGGIRINYQVTGTGQPLLMLAPGGFDATIAKWSAGGIWKEVMPLETFGWEFQMIAYDRREMGASGGRIEPLTWDLYAEEALGLLDHLGIKDAYVIGGCIGCSLAARIAAIAPARCKALLLHWPVGGYRWMLKGRTAFDAHLKHIRAHGLAGAVESARKTPSFWRDAAGGPWAAVIAGDAAFADAFLRQDLGKYTRIVEQSRDNLFNDTMPSGATGAELMAMKVPAHIMSGDDASHATSAAHALRELMPDAKLSPLMPPQQNGATVSAWIRAAAGA